MPFRREGSSGPERSHGPCGEELRQVIRQLTAGVSVVPLLTFDAKLPSSKHCMKRVWRVMHGEHVSFSKLYRADDIASARELAHEGSVACFQQLPSVLSRSISVLARCA